MPAEDAAAPHAWTVIEQMRNALILLLSAVAYALCFPPAALSALALVAVVPLIAVATGETPGRAALWGYLWAVAMAVGITDWLPPAISLYYEQPLWLGIVIFLGATAVMVAVHYAVFAAYCSYVFRRYPRAWPFLAAAAWVVAELARSRLLTGNPWGLFGATQIAVGVDGYDGYGAFALRLVQIAEVGGIYAVSFLLCLINAVVVQSWHDGRLRRSGERGQGGPAMIATVALVAAALGYGHLRVATYSSAIANATRVSVVQANLDLGYRWERAHYGRNLDAYLALTRQALDANDPALVVWPENAMTFFLDTRGDYRMTIAQVTEPAGVELLAGGPRYEEGAERTDYFNSAFVLSAEGEVTGVYDKEHLLPFAEYFPFGSIELLRRSFVSDEGSVSQITPGVQVAALQTVAGRAGVAICNEIMFPDVVGRRVADGADFLLNLANDGWMRSDEFAEHQLVLAIARAIEQRRYLVRASTSGPSAFVDPAGRIVSRTGAYEATVLNGEISPSTARTVYARVGDLFALCCLLVVVATALRRR
jgi:apolipoprotein N-acyltransferase